MVHEYTAQMRLLSQVGRTVREDRQATPGSGPGRITGYAMLRTAQDHQPTRQKNNPTVVQALPANNPGQQ